MIAAIIGLLIYIFDLILKGPVALLFRFIIWFYTTLIPFIVQYIGIPMFALGILLALAFAGGTVLFVIVFSIFMFYFIKGTLFSSKPKTSVV
jgi:hypothetical protein